MKNFQVVNSEDRDRVINYIKLINIEKPLAISIKEYKPNRSLAQNRLYFRWIGIIANDLGYTTDELHAVMASKFLGFVDISCMGETISQLVSTASLKVKEFAEYLTRIEVFAASELGIVLPNSDDDYYESMNIRR